MYLYYHLKSEYFPSTRTTIVREKGLGSLIYSREHRTFLRLQADSLAREYPGSRVFIHPEEGIGEVMDKENGRLRYFTRLLPFESEKNRKKQRSRTI